MVGQLASIDRTPTGGELAEKVCFESTRSVAQIAREVIMVRNQFPLITKSRDNAKETKHWALAHFVIA